MRTARGHANLGIRITRHHMSLIVNQTPVRTAYMDCLTMVVVVHGLAACSTPRFVCTRASNAHISNSPPGCWITTKQLVAVQSETSNRFRLHIITVSHEKHAAQACIRSPIGARALVTHAVLVRCIMTETNQATGTLNYCMCLDKGQLVPVSVERGNVQASRRSGLVI